MSAPADQEVTHVRQDQDQRQLRTLARDTEADNRDGRHAQAAYDEGYADGHDPSTAQEVRRERFGGLNPGAAFFGWLVAIAVSVLLTGIVGAVVAGVGNSSRRSRSPRPRRRPAPSGSSPRSCCSPC